MYDRELDDIANGICSIECQECVTLGHCVSGFDPCLGVTLTESGDSHATT